ncbi:MAG: 1-acyl-sn-glycerol-3-phosphate acyltransferase [Fibrobacteria bacterium]|nr:1-acyl-sn-glycerol-3-phosphate acyltransferase [Fibrobacteria bacterium]
MNTLSRIVELSLAELICGFVRALTSVRATWIVPPRPRGARVYFANHASHADFTLIWASLPLAIRSKVRPVAARDYWESGILRPYLARKVFRAVLIDRGRLQRDHNPVEAMAAVLEAGEPLIVFPEGTRNTQDDLQPFKSGLFHLAERCPTVEFVPVWIENMARVMPKGSFVPIPLLCSVTYGPPIAFDGSSKQDFLEKARAALLALKPDDESREGNRK